MKRSDITDVQVVQACIDFHAGTDRISGGLLMERTRAPRSVVLAAMDRAEKRGLIEYGVSLWSAWPTDEGWALFTGEGDV